MPRRRRRVAATLNEYVSIDNPLDYHTFIWRQEDKLAATFSAALSGGFDIGMLILDVPTQAHMNPDAWLTTARGFRRAANETKARAAVVASLPECMPLDLADELAADDVAPMMGLDDALDRLRGRGIDRAQLGARSGASGAGRIRAAGQGGADADGVRGQVASQGLRAQRAGGADLRRD